MPDWVLEVSGVFAALVAVVFGVAKLVPWNSLFSWRLDRRAQRSDFVAQRIEPVEQFSQVIFEFHDRLAGIIGMWGPDAQYDNRTYERAIKLCDTYRRQLTQNAVAAREAARRIDSELDQLVQDLESASVNIVISLDNSLTKESARNFSVVPTQMGFFIERNDKTLALQQKLVDRIRELLS